MAFRIKETVDSDGISTYYPQYRMFFMWLYYEDVLFDYISLAEMIFPKRKKFFSYQGAYNYIACCEFNRPIKKVIYHKVLIE